MNQINLPELNLENLSRWPMSVKLGLLLGLSMLTILLAYWFIIKSSFEEYEVLHAKEITLKSDFKTKQYLASNLQAYRDQLQLMEENFATMLEQLPAKNEMPGLLEEISKTGIASGLKFELFAPQKEVEHDFYVELPIKNVVRGSYFQLASFLSRVGEMNRIVTLHEFSIEALPSKDNANEPEDELVMSITAKIYRYRVRT